MLPSLTSRFDVHLFDLAGTPVTLMTLLTFIIICIATFWASRLVQRAIERGLSLRGITDRGTVGVTQRLVHYGIMIVGLGIGLQTVGINLSALFAAGALFAVAVGFAMQNYVQNFVSGLTLLIERAIKPGDILEVDGQVITVVDMRIRTTVARTRDEEDLIIPNSLLVQGTVKNFTFQDRLHRIRVDVGVSYDSDLRVTMAALERAATAMTWRLDTLTPFVCLQGFGASSVDFWVAVWVRDPWTEPRYKSELRLAVWDALKEDGIVIAYPQLDVHFDADVVSLPPAA